MNIAVFVSGSGTNLQAIVDMVKRGYIKAKIALVVSDNKEAYALNRAQKAGIETLVLDPEDFKSREEFDKEIIRNLKKHDVELIALAGYMRLLTPYFIKEYRNRILNVHPALLPSFKGKNGVKDALDYGVKFSGCTVHFVDDSVDSGPIITQAAVPILDNDTPDTLAARILKEEHRIYTEAINLVLSGKYRIEGRRVIRT